MMNFTHRFAIAFLALAVVAPAVQAKTHKHHKGKTHKQHSSKSKAPKHHSVAQREELQLRAVAKRIDHDTRDLQTDSHIETLADQFHVPLTTVEDLQNHGENWGNISITLAMAESLSLKDPQHYSSTADGITQIQSIRSKSKNWQQVASRAGIPFQPVLTATARSYRSLVASGRTEHASLVSAPKTL